MKRWIYFLYGVGCYLLFLATFVYMAGFVGNFIVPKTIDTPVSDQAGWAVIINLSLLFLFGAQHSVMARPAFKKIWTKIVPEPIERSTYVLLTCMVTILLMWQWRALDTVVWNVQHPVVNALLWGLFAIGWLGVPAVSLLIDHFDLFGTRQVWLYLKGKAYESLPFRVPSVYRNVRHPLYVGWTIFFWATPRMTLGHLLFATVLTSYMWLAAIIEERDLIAHFGNQYKEYRRRVPMFLPRLQPVSVTQSIPEIDSGD